MKIELMCPTDERLSLMAAEIESLRELMLRVASEVADIRAAIVDRPMTPHEAAEYLGISETTLAAYRSRGGGGPAFLQAQRGAFVRYTRAALEEWLTDRSR